MTLDQRPVPMGSGTGSGSGSGATKRTDPVPGRHVNPPNIRRPDPPVIEWQSACVNDLIGRWFLIDLHQIHHINLWRLTDRFRV